MTDDELLDEIASYGLVIEKEDLLECLDLANEVFCGRKFTKVQREYAEKLLERLKENHKAGGGS
jgi:hypothetical protein